jgi:hypothetical protein
MKTAKGLSQIFHNYNDWEEFHAGMWRHVGGSERLEYLNKAIEFTGDAELYGSWMMRVVDEWPISCEQNLTCSSLNRQAWIGHAACCLAIGCPEDITRAAWRFLSQKQQDEANAMADKAIAEWERRHKEKLNECPLFSQIK